MDWNEGASDRLISRKILNVEANLVSNVNESAKFSSETIYRFKSVGVHIGLAGELWENSGRCKNAQYVVDYLKENNLNAMRSENGEN